MMQSPNFPPPTVRSSNFELLRIFCMLSIVAVHYVWHGGSAASGSNIAAAYFLGNFAQIGVACFVLIGAWFLIDKEFSITRKKRYQILNYLNCEAHLDKLRTVVSKLK